MDKSKIYGNTVSEGESLRSQFRAWLKEICPGGKVEDYCQIMADSAAPEVMKVRVFTHDYRYSIIATERPDEPEKLQRALFSCEATRRKSLAGLTEYTYTRLVDGYFTRATWELIKAAILCFELVKITAQAKEEQWRKMSTYYESEGKQYYDEWLQKGKIKSEYKTYLLVKGYGIKKPTMRDPVPKLK